MRPPLGVVTHTGKQGLRGGCVIVVDLFIHDRVTVTDAPVAFFRFQSDRLGVKTRTTQQRALAVLLTIEVRQQAHGVRWIVHVDRGVGIGPDHNHSKSRVGDRHHTDSHDQPLQEAVAGTPGVAQAIPQHAAKQQKHQNQTAVKGQAQAVDHEQVKGCPQAGNAGYDEKLNTDDKGDTNTRGDQGVEFGRVLCFFKVVEQRQRREGQQAEQVYPDGQGH